MRTIDIDRTLKRLLIFNPEAFESLLLDMKSENNAVRNHGKSVFKELHKHPNLLVKYLVSSTCTSTVEKHRSFSAVLLLRCLAMDSHALWDSLNSSVVETMKSDLMSTLSTIQQQDVSEKICNVIAEIASFLLAESGWSELLLLLFDLLNSKDERMLFAGFHIVGSLALRGKLDLFEESIPELLSCFDVALGSGSALIQAKSIDAFCNIAESLADSNLHKQFQPLMPKIMNSLSEFLRSGNIVCAEQILHSLVDLVQESPVFLSKELPKMIPAILAIASSKELTSGLRILAAELLVRVCEKKDRGLKSLLKRIPSFYENLFELLMLFLMDIEDIPEWHQAVDDEDEDLGSGELYDCGHESLNRVAIGLGGKILMPIANAMLTNCSKGSDWKRQYGVLICLSQIAEGCADVMLQEVDQLIDLCIYRLHDNTAKVRWAACYAIGRLCTHLGPNLQASNHQKVVPALIEVMRDKHNPRVQAHAADAIVNFIDDCKKEDVENYLDMLVSHQRL